MPTATPDDQDNQKPARKSRLDRELEEILATSRADSLTAKPARKRPVQLPYHRSTRQPQWSGLFAPHRRGALMIVVSLLLAMLAVLVSDASPLLANLLVIAAVIAFAYPIVARFRSPTSTSSMPPPSRTWRGRDVDIEPRRPSPIEGIRDLWNRRQRR